MAALADVMQNAMMLHRQPVPAIVFAAAQIMVLDRIKLNQIPGNIVINGLKLTCRTSESKTVLRK